MPTKTFTSHHQHQEIKGHLALIKQQCDKIKDYVNLEVFPVEQLGQCQEGYSVDLDGNSFVTDDEDTWDENWIVIGYETLCGDPIIIDLNEAGYPVSLLWHGMGSWDNGIYLAHSLESFLATLTEIAHFLAEKQVFKGNRAIRNHEWLELLSTIGAKERFANSESWASLLQPLFELVEAYEEEMQTKVQQMKAEGKTISEIAARLNIQPKDVYKYSKKISHR